MNNKFFSYNVLTALLVISSLFVTASVYAKPGSKDGQLHLTFGIYQSDKATVMYRKFIPVIDLLQQSLERHLAHPVDIKLEIFRSYKEGIDAIANGHVDFVRFGPSSYILAKHQNSRIRLLAMEHKKGKKRFKGVIAVRSDSDFEKLGELKGKRFAFGSQYSTIGRYLSQNELIKAGVSNKSLQGFDYLGRHDKVFMAVSVGDFDAGSLKYSTFKRLNKNNRLRVLTDFYNVTKPWIASGSMDDIVYQALRSVLLNVADINVLKAMKISGFMRTEDSEYDFVRKAMQASKTFAE